jgi:hypothetical protein
LATRIVVREDTGDAFAVGRFEKSSSLLIANEETRSAIDTGNIVESLRIEYPFAIAQSTSGLCVLNLVTNDRTSIPLNDIHWFVVARNVLSVYHQDSMLKVALEEFPQGMYAAPTKIR